MKALSLSISSLLAVLFFASLAFASPAVVVSSEGCNLLDGEGNFVFTTDTHRVATASANGNTNFTCKADVANNSRGAVHYDFASTGVLCGVLTQSGFVLTEDWKQNISASGKATLQCRYKAN